MILLYQGIIFDLDGTLLDTITDLANAGNFVCEQMGWPQHSIEAYKKFVGNGIPMLVQRFSPAEYRQPQQLEQTLAAFRQRYAAHTTDCTCAYEGIPELVQQLSEKGIPMGVLTNKEQGFAEQILKQYFPSQPFSVIQGAVANFPPKPDPKALLFLLQHPAFAGKKILFVGDSDVDILTAHAAGLEACGVLWGFRDRAELSAACAEHLVEHPSEIANLLEKELCCSY